MNQIRKNSAIICAVSVMLVQPLATGFGAEHSQLRRRVNKQAAPVSGQPAPRPGPVFSGPPPGSTTQRFNQPQMPPPPANSPNSSSVKIRKRHSQDEEAPQSTAAPARSDHGTAKRGKEASSTLKKQSTGEKKQAGKAQAGKKSGSPDQSGQSVFREGKSGNENRPNSTPAAAGVLPQSGGPVPAPATAPPVIAVPVQTPMNRNLPSQPQPAPLGPANLSPEERARFSSAHEAALRDPSLAASRDRYMQARREYRDKLRDGILRADPNVQPILEKVRKGNRNRQP